MTGWLVDRFQAPHVLTRQAHQSPARTPPLSLSLSLIRVAVLLPHTACRPRSNPPAPPSLHPLPLQASSSLLGGRLGGTVLGVRRGGGQPRNNGKSSSSGRAFDDGGSGVSGGETPPPPPPPPRGGDSTGTPVGTTGMRGGGGIKGGRRDSRTPPTGARGSRRTYPPLVEPAWDGTAAGAAGAAGTGGGGGAGGKAGSSQLFSKKHHF